MKEKKIKMVILGALFKSEMGGIKDLLVLLGKGKEAREIDKEYQRRKFFGPWGLRELAKLYQGFPENKLKETALNYCQQNLLKGIRKLSVELKKRGFIIGVISPNPQFMMDVLKEILLLDFAIGTQLEFKEGIATGRIQKEINRYTRAEILKIKRKEYGVDKEDVITIGRSTITHLPMARESGVFIALDQRKESISDIARIIATDKNLRKIFFGN